MIFHHHVVLTRRLLWVRRSILMIGGEENSSLFSVHVFDIPTWCWLRSTFTTDGGSPARRHTGT